jgi:hypothetical protein
MHISNQPQEPDASPLPKFDATPTPVSDRLDVTYLFPCYKSSKPLRRFPMFRLELNLPTSLAPRFDKTRLPRVSPQPPPFHSAM